MASEGKKTVLGRRDFILLAMLTKSQPLSGLELCDLYNAKIKSRLSRGAFYGAMERLEERKLVSKVQDDLDAEVRGGNKRSIFSATDLGKKFIME